MGNRSDAARESDVVARVTEMKGMGLFAARDFKKGDVVLRWHPKILTPAKEKDLPDQEKPYLLRDGNDILLMQPPERFVNHSCDPNTVVQDRCDVALRDIRSGEEITSDYGTSAVPFRCLCGAKQCRGEIGEQ